MVKYNANTFIRSKLGPKIALFVFILIILVIINLVIVSYYQSQMTYLGNSINIAGKNRFLTSNLMYHISEYLFEDNTKNSSTVTSAINQLESNILVLREGGNIVSGIELKPLPREFLEDWNIIYQKWFSLKTNVANKIFKSTNNEMTNSESPIDKDKVASKLETESLSLVDSSNLLVTKLSDYLKNNSEYILFIQKAFTILITIVITAFAFCISSKILKPILSLTSSISEINGEKLNVIISQNKGNNSNNKNELSVFSNSFNYMVNYIKSYIKKQDKLIKELEKANEELKYKDQLKNEFINVAAHEIKTPIQPIVALAEVIKQEGINNIENNKEYLDIIFRNSRRLKQVTEDVLDIARIESGSFSLNKEKFNLNELITEILKEYEQKIQNKKNIKLLYHPDDSNKKIIIDADRNRLSQVIYNLLENAIKFTEEGSITVIVERKKGNTDDKFNNEILVSIKDTGTGIHPEVLSKLFTKFATKSHIVGTGLGLFISKIIIEMHGGKIWAMNNNEIDKEKGVGSTFTFSLPIKR